MKQLLTQATAILVSAISVNLQAALLPTSNLSIQPGTLNSNLEQPIDGSWMALNVGAWAYSPIEGINGINLGTTQLSDDVPSGNIDIWEFLGNPAAHQSSSPISILSDDGAGNVQLDFSGWNYIQPTLFPQSVDIGYAGSNTIATMACDNNCSNGENFVLDLESSINIWPYDIGNTTSVPYRLHIEGFISAVPLPASLFLFGSGLLGLIGLSTSKKKEHNNIINSDAKSAPAI